MHKTTLSGSGCGVGVGEDATSCPVCREAVSGNKVKEGVGDGRGVSWHRASMARRKQMGMAMEMRTDIVFFHLKMQSLRTNLQFPYLLPVKGTKRDTR